jgi:hypothetical protein
VRCEMCLPGSVREADRKITYGLYAAYAAGRPHNVLCLCGECSHKLWDGEGCSTSLRALVTAGLCHFVVEPL